MTLKGVRGADSTDRVDVNVSSDGFARRDLYIGSGARDGRLSGTIVTADNGQPLPGAQVIVESGSHSRANDRGVWTVADAPLGTHNIDVRAVGFYPEHRAVDIVDGAPPIRIALSTMKAVLDTVKISATRTYSRNLAVFETHRRTGLGAYITREQVQRRHLYRLSDLFKAMNGIRIERTDQGDVLLVRGSPDMSGGWCTPVLWIDGVSFRDVTVDQLDLWVQPNEVVGIELYAGIIVPPQFQTPLGGCGALVIWTK
jgi:hypothetical protein